MLGMKTYTREYIDSCRARVAADLAAYRNLTDATPPGSAVADFEASFFNNMVLLLDYFFVHRLRTIEGKDGNPLNEVRSVCDSMLLNSNVVGLPVAVPASAGKGLKVSSAKSVLGLQPGDTIRLTEADFLRISDAFFAEIESKYL